MTTSHNFRPLLETPITHSKKQLDTNLSPTANCSNLRNWSLKVQQCPASSAKLSGTSGKMCILHDIHLLYSKTKHYQYFFVKLFKKEVLLSP